MKFKTLLVLSVLLTASMSMAQDRAKALATTNLLQGLVTASQSTTPNRAFGYWSSATNVDDHGVVQALTINTSAPNQLIITRGAELQAGGQIAIASCSADFGSVTFNATTITINSDRRPLRVRCVNADNSRRVFYTTYQE